MDDSIMGNEKRNYFLKDLFIYFRKKQGGPEGRERENLQADPPLSTETDAGLNLTTHEIMT